MFNFLTISVFDNVGQQIEISICCRKSLVDLKSFISSPQIGINEILSSITPQSWGTARCFNVHRTVDVHIEQRILKENETGKISESVRGRNQANAANRRLQVVWASAASLRVCHFSSPNRIHGYNLSSVWPSECLRRIGQSTCLCSIQQVLKYFFDPWSVLKLPITKFR